MAIITGTARSDRLNGTNQNDTLLGAGGNDLLAGRRGNDLLDGGAGTLDLADYRRDPGGVRANLLAGRAIDGWGGTDRFTGVEGLVGSRFADGLTGDNGPNWLIGGRGNDVVNGGIGTDWADYQLDVRGVTVNLDSGTATDGSGGTDTLRNIEYVSGSRFNDTLIGNGRANYLRGNRGNDDLTGGGNESSTAADWADYTFDPAGVSASIADGRGRDGWGGTDTYTAVENLTGSAFADVLQGDAGINWLRGRNGADSLDGGAGLDWADFRADPAGVTVNLAQGTATDGWGNTDTLQNMEAARGTEAIDVLIGNEASNWLNGRAGDDSINGAAGTDWVSYADSSSAVTINLATGAVSGNDGVDTLASIEAIEGSVFDDRLTGNDGPNLFHGIRGDDTIDGGGGNDILLIRDLPTNVTARRVSGSVFEVTSTQEGTDTVRDIERVSFYGNTPVSIDSLVQAISDGQTATPMGGTGGTATTAQAKTFGGLLTFTS